MNIWVVCKDMVIGYHRIMHDGWTYVMKPEQFFPNWIGFDVALKINVVAFFYIIRGQCWTQLDWYYGWIWEWKILFIIVSSDFVAAKSYCLQTTFIFQVVSRNNPFTLGFSARHVSVFPSSSVLGEKLSVEIVVLWLRMSSFARRICRLPLYQVMMAFGLEPVLWQDTS